MRSASRGTWFTLLVTVVIAVAVWDARVLPSAPRLFPLAVGLPALAASAFQLVGDARGRTVSPARILDIGDDSGLPPDVVARRAVRYFAWFCGFLVAAVMIGFYLAFGLFILAYQQIEARARVVASAAITLVTLALVYGLLERVLTLPVPRGLLLRPFL